MDTSSIRSRAPHSRQKGFSLIELMVVVAIIGILAMIALPQYQRFTAKARLAAALAEIAPGKIGVEALIAEGTELVADTSQIGLPPKTPRCDQIDYLPESDGTVTLSCRLNTDSIVGGGILSLKRDEQGMWECASESIDSNLLPAGCKA